MEKQFAYSMLTVKQVSEDKREISGWATTPEADRMGDIIEPMGARFKNPTVLLWMHNHSLPVGSVTFGKATEKGVPFTAKLPNILEPSQLKARIDEAWQSIKSGIIAAVSIGFRPLEYSIMEDTGGLRFTSIDIFELSLVAVPAQPNATITQIKSFDASVRASMGNKDNSVNNPSEVTENKSKTVKISKTKEKEMSIAEKLKGFKDERAKKAKKLQDMMEKSLESGETFNEAEQEEYETLEAEVKALDTHIEKADNLFKKALETAIPVNQEDGEDEGKALGVRKGVATVKSQEKLDKGINFARLARCKALSKMNGESVSDIAKNLYGEESKVYGVVKAAIAAGTTTHATWAGPLVGDESDVFADFAEFLRPMTILGKFGAGGIPGLTTVPFRTRLISGTSGGDAYWTGEAAPKGLTKFDFAGTTLEPLKVANIAVVSMELLRDSSPRAEVIIRNELAKALAARLDIDFLDPGKYAVAGVSPASISANVVPIASSGTDADAVRCDLAALLQAYAAANNPPSTGVIVMSANMAIALMGMRNALGQKEFSDITMSGGTLEGFPVIVSQYVSGFGDSTGEFVFMINADDIYVGDEGGVQIDLSDQASLQMDSEPTNPPVAATVLVSLWQHNLIGFRAERTINWAKRRTSAVAVLDGVNWSACVTS